MIMMIYKAEQIKEIINALIEGKVLVLPSETSYGFSCDATNQTAVDKIFKIKGRASGKPVLVLVDSISMAKKYLSWSAPLKKLAGKYWDQDARLPLTIVGNYQKKFLIKRLAPSALSTENTLAVRVTHHAILQDICRRLGRPVISTSANIAGAQALYNPDEISKQFSGQDISPDAVVDAGVLPIRPASTIISVVTGQTRILRQGDLKIV
ncbi:MAG: L-threonylcarbamoyladenylate synthase [Candidatus Magasanikbacteria bacterium]|jgi:L-threonylcarbamoyladenylate synthase